ncbi:hypothetical protein Csa_015499, partial [Cucumis sativus]
ESGEVAPSDMMSQNGEVLEEVNDKTCLPSLPKTTTETSKQKDKMKKLVREDEEGVYEDYIFKFLDHY